MLALAMPVPRMRSIYDAPKRYPENTINCTLSFMRKMACLCPMAHIAEIFLIGGRGNQRIAMSSDLIRDR
ncbi:hypothetical protein AB3X96_05295 [Paraburkholderia sp. BR13439]|uniref:hypothetical protein n=1 Tax=Paraburkholderia TaxID=1822464 RepID=UPI0034CF0009